MSIQTVVRYCVVLSFTMLVNGCSILDFDEPTRNTGSMNHQTTECSWNRSSCMYEGPYEPDERAYAEQEAKRLNRAALDRLRRSSGRF